MSGNPASAMVTRSSRYSACAQPSGVAEPLGRAGCRPRALAGEDGPRPSATAAVPGRSVLVFAVPVSDIAPPAWAGGQTDLQGGVNALQAAEDALVLGTAQPVTHELEKLGGDGAFGRAMVWVSREAHVMAGGG